MFQAEKVCLDIVHFIQDYFEKNHLGGVLIGISGGKDSAVVAGLFVKALGKDKVIGVMMPCHSDSQDCLDAQIVQKAFGFSLLSFDLTSTFDTFYREAQQLEDFVVSNDSNMNLKPRLRMATLYYLAQMYSVRNHSTYIVAGCGNQCEEYVGYFTKGGDSVSDIKVLSDLTVEEVIQIGEVLNVPKEILYKPPSDGLSGLSDEEKLGVSYQDISRVIHHQDVREDIYHKIDVLHQKCQHKFQIPTFRKEK